MAQGAPSPDSTLGTSLGQADETQAQHSRGLPSESLSTHERSRRSLVWLVIHWLIILHFLGEIIYAGYMIFSVLQPEGHSGPLMGQATQIPFELMVTRRLYALECWVATAGLAIYLAITEVAPRMRSLK